MFGKSRKTNETKIKKDNAPKKTKNESTLTKSLENNISLFKNIFSGDETLIIRRFQNKYLAAAKCCILYFDGMVNTEILNENIIQPILSGNLAQEISGDNLLEELQYKVIVCGSVQATADIDELIGSITYGDTIFLLEGYEKALIINSKGWKTRAISEPESTRVVRGPREGFNESIIINLSLVRRKIKNPDLKFKFKQLGERTHTKICICYIEGLALDSILSELEQRLDKIDIDGVIDSGYIQEFIRDEPFSPFETVGYSERPDVVAAKLLEGRIAVFVDGSPFVLTVPFVIAETTQANEDYYNNYIYSSINRFLRSSATIISVSIPALYLAVTTYHQEMLPTPLLLSIAASRQGVPFPTFVSLLLMLIVFDVLREAGTRMPAPIGQAVNIVGTLVLGQAAVEARLVSAPVVIITALSGITTLMNIGMIGATIIVRTFLLLTTSFMGIYGYILGFMIVIIHLMTMRSFGVPYMLNLSTFKNHNAQDVWIRAPWWTMTLRPKIIAAKNLVRQSTRKNNRGK
ncbi:MAG: spore germination protein [Clostridia bacterium]|nr:spore germination protein [Clostridia bacterium]